MLAPADVAGALVFLVSDLSTYMNGQNIIVDDGWSR
jgi:NAD(P)-dependent dehydrogenase (short-subunit alcohol dehydrogenase family)